MCVGVRNEVTAYSDYADKVNDRRSIRGAGVAPEGAADRRPSSIQWCVTSSIIKAECGGERTKKGASLTGLLSSICLPKVKRITHTYFENIHFVGEINLIRNNVPVV